MTRFKCAAQLVYTPNIVTEKHIYDFYFYSEEYSRLAITYNKDTNNSVEFKDYLTYTPHDYVIYISRNKSISKSALKHVNEIYLGYSSVNKIYFVGFIITLDLSE